MMLNRWLDLGLIPSRVPRREKGWGRAIAAWLAWVVLAPSPSWAGKPSLVPPGLSIAFSTREQSALAADRRGSLEGELFLRAALAACDVPEANQRRFLEQLEFDVGELRSECRAVESDLGRARRVLEFLHERILSGGYAEDCTNPVQTLKDGQFNCVSATILYCHLARRCGLLVDALELPGHVVARVSTDEGWRIVETTSLAAIDAGTASPTRPLANFDAASTSSRQLSNGGLVALVYYNQGVDLLERHDYPAALAANVKALRFDPDNAMAFGNLLATLNNWALDLETQGNLTAAMSLLRHGHALAPEHRPFAVNWLALSEHRVNDYCAAHDYQQARDWLDQARRQFQPQANDDVLMAGWSQLNQRIREREQKWLRARNHASRGDAG